MNLLLGNFMIICRERYKFCYNQVQISGTMHEDLSAFYCCWRHQSAIQTPFKFHSRSGLYKMILFPLASWKFCFYKRWELLEKLSNYQRFKRTVLSGVALDNCNPRISLWGNKRNWSNVRWNRANNVAYCRSVMLGCSNEGTRDGKEESAAGRYSERKAS